jgi:hypothetical protein
MQVTDDMQFADRQLLFYKFRQFGRPKKWPELFASPDN